MIHSSEVAFNTMTDEVHAAQVLSMMRGLYAEDQPATAADPERFPLNIRQLLDNPASGRIVLFTDGDKVCGYAILIPYWSNEYGGMIVFVDELFVVPEARGRGIGSRFFEFVTVARPFDAVAVLLEVSPSNRRARRLYESLGFKERANATLAYSMPRC